MKRALMILGILAVISAPLSAADLINKDNQAYEITAVYGTMVYGGNEAPVPITFRIIPGYTYKYICGSCTLSYNGQNVAVTETDVVTIQGGQLVKSEE